MKTIVLFVAGFLLSSPVFGCYVPTGDLDHEHRWLIEQTPLIVYGAASTVDTAKNVPHARQPAEYNFRVIRVLKGDAAETLSIDGDANLDGIWDTTFSDHSNEQFWVAKTGRLGNIGDCVTTPAPEFILGKSYLLFIGGPDDSKRFERIDSEQDRWLVFVKAHLDSKHLTRR